MIGALYIVIIISTFWYVVLQIGGLKNTETPSSTGTSSVVSSTETINEQELESEYYIFEKKGNSEPLLIYEGDEDNNIYSLNTKSEVNLVLSNKKEPKVFNNLPSCRAALLS